MTSVRLSIRDVLLIVLAFGGVCAIAHYAFPRPVPPGLEIVFATGQFELYLDDKKIGSGHALYRIPFCELERHLGLNDGELQERPLEVERLDWGVKLTSVGKASHPVIWVSESWTSNRRIEGPYGTAMQIRDISFFPDRSRPGQVHLVLRPMPASGKMYETHMPSHAP